MATNIFSIMEGLTVSREDIVEAELFAEQYLSASFPTYDFRQGTALRDMTVRPNATLLALVKKSMQYYFDNTDIINMTDSTDNDIVDRKLSNFFITRKTGNKSVIRARLFFSFPLNTPINTLVPVSAFFSTNNDVMFYPQGNVTILYTTGTRDPNNYYFDYDGSSDQWYCDINLESKDSSLDANIESGDLLYFTIFSPYFLRGQIQYLIESAIADETNTEMVARSYSAVSTRNLINTPSIIARVTDKFNYVKQVYPVGLGNPWLFRDIISIESVETPGQFRDYHRGGHTDVYISTLPSTSVVQLVAEVDRENPSNGAAFYIKGPIINVTRTRDVADNASNDTVPYYVNPSNPNLGLLPFEFSSVNVSTYSSGSIPVTPSMDLGLSADHIVKIKFEDNSVLPGDTATFKFDVLTGVGSVDDNLHSVDERVVCADYIARGFEPVFLDIVIDTRGFKVSSAIKTEVKSLVDKYVSDISYGGTLYVTEVINSIIDGGVRDFKMPLNVSSHRYPKDTRGDETGHQGIENTTIVDSMSLLDIRKFYLRDITYIEV